MSRISKRKLWKVLKKEPEREPTIFKMQFEDWVKGYKRFRKQEEQQLAMAEKLCEEQLKRKKKNADN